MSSQAEARVLGFDLWLEEVGRKRPSKVFVRIRGRKDIMTGETYVHEPWFMDGRTEVRAYLPVHSRPFMDVIHRKIVDLGYVVYGFGESGGEVIVHYRRGGRGMRVYRFRVDDRCPRCGWRVSSAYVVASSEGEAKSLMERCLWLCGNCIADMLADKGYI